MRVLIVTVFVLLISFFAHAEDQIQMRPVTNLNDVAGLWIQKSISCVNPSGVVQKFDTAQDVHNELMFFSGTNIFRENRNAGGWMERVSNLPGESCEGSSLGISGDVAVLEQNHLFTVNISYDNKTAVRTGRCIVLGQFNFSKKVDLFWINSEDFGTLLQDSTYFGCSRLQNTRPLIVWERSPDA